MKKCHAPYALFWLVLAILATSCSSAGPEQATPGAPSGEETTVAQDAAPSTEPEPTQTAQATPEPSLPTLADEDLAGVVALDAGEQVEDTQGNLVAIYGYQRWPASFGDLPDAAQSTFPFVEDLDALADPRAQLVALDVAMCSAGLDGSGFGTAEFFVHSAATEPLLVGTSQGHGLFAAHPVISPGFTFPAPAECARGWVPVLWSDDADAAVARYLVTTRASASGEVERYLYQWEIDLTEGDADADAAVDQLELDVFPFGQTVTFNEGALEESTVQVQGWAELIGRDAPIEGTRLVGVRMQACPAAGVWPDFGLALDGWNLTAAVEVSEQLVVTNGVCFDDWLEFAVPFGAIPTGFFASDGADPTYGYAEWSLVDAAIAPPAG